MANEPRLYSISCSVGVGGTLAVSRHTAPAGTKIQLTPTPKTGYKLKSLTTSPYMPISKNTFTMPDSNIMVTATFEKVAYKITRASTPAAGGTVTVTKNGSAVVSAYMGDTIAYSATAAAGYVRKGVSFYPPVTKTTTTFTMPADNVTVAATFWKISTGTLNKTSMNGGENVTLTIAAGDADFTHRYKLSFGANMETAWTSVAKGVKTVSISVPLNWSAQITSQTSKTGGTLTLECYSGSTLVGTSTITGLTYKVPASVVPTIGTLTTAIVRTIDGTTYGNIGEYYIQNHSGVRVTASASGAQGSSILSLKVAIGGYSGSKYNKTVTTSSIDFTSGLLSTSGNVTITVTATDGRGRTATRTATIDVKKYSNPTGSLSVWRVDENGDADDMGSFGKYELTKSYTALAGNTFTWRLTYTGGTATEPPDSGNLLPGDRKVFNTMLEYPFTLELEDGLETVQIQANLPSARFIIAFDSTGDKIGIMKYPNQPIPAGKEHTFEIAENVQVYIGNMTLEDYIRSIVNN